MNLRLQIWISRTEQAAYSVLRWPHNEMPTRQDWYFTDNHLFTAPSPPRQTSRVYKPGVTHRVICPLPLSATVKTLRPSFIQIRRSIGVGILTWPLWPACEVSFLMSRQVNSGYSSSELLAIRDSKAIRRGCAGLCVDQYALAVDVREVKMRCMNTNAGIQRISV